MIEEPPTNRYCYRAALRRVEREGMREQNYLENMHKITFTAQMNHTDIRKQKTLVKMGNGSLRLDVVCV